MGDAAVAPLLVYCVVGVKRWLRLDCKALPPPPLPLPQGPAVTMVRRHARASDQGVSSYGPALSTVTGNYVAAKRKGVVNGVDYQYTGVVRFVQVGGQG